MSDSPSISGITCSACGSTNRIGARFCNTCGSNLLKNPLQSGKSSYPGHSEDGRNLHGRYSLLRRIGQGGMGVVYEAFDNNLQRVVVIKELLSENLDLESQTELTSSFIQEARFLANLSHPNLATVYDYFVEDERHYLVMELVHGRELQSLIEDRPLPESVAIDIVLQICDALAYLHRQIPPIIFRDLKPSNIILNETSGRVKLIDFGIARFHRRDRKRDTAALGTPGYAAPEQYGSGQTDARTDIYSLGVTLFVLVTSYDVTGNPFTSFSNILDGQVAAKVLTECLAQVIKKATQISPFNRFQTTNELRIALENCRSHSSHVEHPVSSGSTQTAHSPLPANLSPRENTDVTIQDRIKTRILPKVSQKNFSINRHDLNFGRIYPNRRRWRFFAVSFTDTANISVTSSERWLSVHPERICAKKPDQTLIKVCVDLKAVEHGFRPNVRLEVTDGEETEYVSIKAGVEVLAIEAKVALAFMSALTAVLVAVAIWVPMEGLCLGLYRELCSYPSLPALLTGISIVFIASKLLRVQDIANMVFHTSKIALLLNIPTLLVIGVLSNSITPNCGISLSLNPPIIFVVSLLLWCGAFTYSAKHPQFWQE